MFVRLFCCEPADTFHSSGPCSTINWGVLCKFQTFVLRNYICFDWPCKFFWVICGCEIDKAFFILDSIFKDSPKP